MIHGQTIEVVRRDTTGKDAFNMPTYEETVETVTNVLVAPASTVDLDGVARPDGDDINLALHFPKTYTASLRGTAVIVNGKRYEVIGDPQPYMDVNTPGAWNRPVAARLTEG